jgi:hypothetical protein
MKLLSMLKSHIILIVATVMVLGFLPGCVTTPDQVELWEHSGDIAKLTGVATNSFERSSMRRKSLESLARLNWKPTNEERLQVYRLFASKTAYQEASSLMSVITAEQFSEIDSKVIAMSALLDNNGRWTDKHKARVGYDELLALNHKAVTVSLCQQIVAHPELQTKILMLAIKLGLDGSEDELITVLDEYGDKKMAEDYLNCRSEKLTDGAHRWVATHGYRLKTDLGRARCCWGRF